MSLTQNKSTQMIKPMRTKRARGFSLIGFASFALLIFHVAGSPDFRALGIIGLVMSMIGLAYTGVFRACMSPADEIERQIAHKAVFRAYGLMFIGVVIFLTAAGLVAQLAEISANNGREIGSGFIGGGLFSFYDNYEKPRNFWNDIFWIFTLMGVFTPAAIMAWLIPTVEIDPEGF